MPDDPKRRCRVLYVSPLKALAVDVERNLRSPLAGIRQAAARLDLPRPDITVAMRSGDTPADERRAFARHPADILITTPESLFLLLTSAAREALRGVDTVIVDEVHAVCATKRGAHLALTLERLDALLDQPAQRIGLSATVRPVDEVATFLAGGRPVTVVQPPIDKTFDLTVVVPIEDMSALGELTDDLSGPAAGAERRASIWPHVEERVLDLVEAHRSTIVFANSRRLAERLTARLNELAAERRDTRWTTPASPPPAQLMAQSGAGHPAGGPQVVARAHHGSVSREQRPLVEEELKAGRLPAVVATSSLELGIDMGAVDLVVQVESPPSVASGLQRVGRAGHQVGAVSRGVIFPKYRGDLRRVRGGRRADARRARSSRCATRATRSTCSPSRSSRWSRMERLTVDEVEALVRRAAPFAGLPRSALEAVLDMLAGRYPSDAFAELRPRLVWDRVTGELDRPARRAAARGHQRRHDPRPRPVRRVPRRRRRPGSPGRRARRGDGLRVAGRRRVPARLVVLAHRGHHPRPGAGHARARARSAGCRSGRATPPAGRSSSAGRSGAFLREVATQRAGGRPGAGPGRRAGRVGHGQPARLPGRAARGHRPPARRPHGPGRAVPRRARRLAAGRALAVRRAGQCAVGAGDRRAAARAVRPRRAVDALRRRHRAAPARHRRRAAGRRPRGVRCRRDRGDGHRRGRRLGAVRVALPRVRGPGPAAAAPRSAPAHAAVAAAPARQPAAAGGQRVRRVPGRARRRCANACRTCSTCPVSPG